MKQETIAGRAAAIRGENWTLLQIDKRLILRPTNGYPETLYTYKTAKTALRRWCDLYDILIQPDLAWISECFPDYIVNGSDHQAACLIWEHAAYGKLSVNLPYPTYELIPPKATEEQFAWKGDAGTWKLHGFTEAVVAREDQSGRARAIKDAEIGEFLVQWDGARKMLAKEIAQIQEALRSEKALEIEADLAKHGDYPAFKQKLIGALCEYSKPHPLCWHDGTSIDVPIHLGRTRPGHPEDKAIRERNIQLATEAILELRRLSHYALREWPMCSVSGEPVALHLDLYAGNRTAYGMFVCRYCNKDYQGFVF